MKTTDTLTLADLPFQNLPHSADDLNHLRKLYRDFIDIDIMVLDALASLGIEYELMHIRWLDANWEILNYLLDLSANYSTAESTFHDFCP